MDRVKLKNDFWKGKRVLVTGYEGFLGSNLTRRLLSLGSRVVGIDKKVFRKDTILDRSDYRKFSVVKCDVANYKKLLRIIKDNKIDIVFHLAAEAIVGKCHTTPLKAFSSNICGTWNALEASRLCGSVSSVVIASSDKAYGSHKKLPYSEDHALTGRHPYDASKSCADMLAQSYFHTFRLPVAITRCGNIFGPGEFNFSRIVPGTIYSALKGKAVDIRSDGHFTRDYIYIDDIVAGYILLAEKLVQKELAGEAFNFSNEKPMEVIEVVRSIYDILGKEPKYRILNIAKFEIKDQYLCSAKAKRILGWKPEFTFKKGVENSIVWYKSHFNL
ncbi:MAG TPA: GDP-mannose 4,6-dehydratase [Candidatus Omnitrophota bacterium]|nr:GDP-mannose 4,6-dehydratase [Candidatus Omnitrophota bacterium]